MQRREFDNLMDGRSAKIADLFKSSCDSQGLIDALSRAKQNGATDEEIETARNEIAKVEIEIDPKIRSEMDKFIAKQREMGTKERTIRRMVQRMWNIQVI